MTNPDTIADCERQAEAAYAAKYEARPHWVNDCYDDARHYFGRAIDAARAAAMTAEVARLTHRLKHIENVYDRQFRGVGR